MKRKIFNAETDFEKQNIDLINKLRMLEDEDLKEDFDERLFAKARSIQPQKKITSGFFAALKEYIPGLVIKSGDRPGRLNMTAAFAYAASVIIIAASGYLYYSNYRQAGPQPQMMAKNEQRQTYQAESKREEAKKEINRETQKEASQPKSPEDKYMAGLLNKVSGNMSYGFVAGQTIDDIKAVLRSEDFKYEISQIKDPVQNDTVKTIIKLLEDK